MTRSPDVFKKILASVDSSIQVQLQSALRAALCQEQVRKESEEGGSKGQGRREMALDASRFTK